MAASLSDVGKVLFLDVETTGLSWFYDEITIVGWVAGGEYKVFISGEDPSALLCDLAAATVLVTFNGTLFDLRFLRKTFGDVELPPIHIDLRYFARRVGLAGGQKNIERELKIKLREEQEDVDGAAAVLLWHDHLRGDETALSSLIRYNRSDVLGMAEILDEVLDRSELQKDFWLETPGFGDIARELVARPLPEVTLDIRSKRQVFRTFKSIFDGTAASKAAVVGIDLTGSDKRPSGVCVLRGDVAQTFSMRSDEEMVEFIQDQKPDLVSIDSPLSLPFGRTMVTDDDPLRDQYGIMRQCERELKRRGVNVYPSLLPSMQGLTQRGMVIAARLRKLGVPVIESYPGAAQDIMSIPRKGAGVSYLKKGLVDFGLNGDFVCSEVSHDELDAITSALVGTFFMAGKYEGLTGPTEGALIIPNLAASNEDTLVVGVSGRICAGKTTASRTLEKWGFGYTRFSLVIDEEILKEGGVLDRETRQRVGMEVHLNKGQRWLCEQVLKRVEGKKLIVVDGLRFPEDHAYMVETFGSRFAHVHISAFTSLRQQRFPSGTAADFAVIDSQPVEAEIDTLRELAHAVIVNESALSDLEASLERLIGQLRGDSKCLSPSS